MSSITIKPFFKKALSIMMIVIIVVVIMIPSVPAIPAVLMVIVVHHAFIFTGLVRAVAAALHVDPVASQAVGVVPDSLFAVFVDDTSRCMYVAVHACIDLVVLCFMTLVAGHFMIFFQRKVPVVVQRCRFPCLSGVAAFTVFTG